MTASTMTQSQNALNMPLRSVPESQPRLSLAELIDLVQKTLVMARSIPDCGPISAKQVEKIRAMAAAIWCPTLRFATKVGVISIKLPAGAGNLI